MESSASRGKRLLDLRFALNLSPYTAETFPYSISLPRLHSPKKTIRSGDYECECAFLTVGIDHRSTFRSGPLSLVVHTADTLSEKLTYDRIGYGVLFNALNLHVASGVVTLGGDVRDYPSRDSALAIVETTPGVKDVIDEINVLPTSIFDDELRIRIARAIYGQAALQRYAMVPEKPIRIIVDKGQVTLQGIVDNAMDKQISETQAKSVPGVFSVDNRLMVATRN